MKRYYIQFEERNSNGRWNTISTEDFETLPEAIKRFKDSVVLSFHNVSSNAIHLIDRYRLKYDPDDDEIATFTLIVD